MVSDAQDRVAGFVATHDLDAPPAYRLLDAASELGELAKDLNESTSVGRPAVRSGDRRHSPAWRRARSHARELS